MINCASPPCTLHNSLQGTALHVPLRVARLVCLALRCCAVRLRSSTFCTCCVTMQGLCTLRDRWQGRVCRCAVWAWGRVGLGAWACAVGYALPLGGLGLEQGTCQALPVCLGLVPAYMLAVWFANCLRFAVDIVGAETWITVCGLVACMLAVLPAAMLAVWGLGFGCALLWTLYPVQPAKLGQFGVDI